MASKKIKSKKTFCEATCHWFHFAEFLQRSLLSLVVSFFNSPLPCIASLGQGTLLTDCLLSERLTNLSDDLWPDSHTQNMRMIYGMKSFVCIFFFLHLYWHNIFTDGYIFGRMAQPVMRVKKNKKLKKKYEYSKWPKTPKRKKSLPNNLCYSPVFFSEIAWLLCFWFRRK